MSRSDPERLAAALRENLKKRKERARTHVAQPSYGSDEEGDVVVPPDGEPRPGAWTDAPPVTPSSETH